jgi:UDP-N-acetylmuramoylalanine-D-glutamate ligase
MLDKEHPDLVVAFPGGRGTTDMISRAKKAGVKVMEIKDD